MWLTALITLRVGQLNAKSLLACVFLITSRTLLNKVAAQEKKEEADGQKVLIRNPFLAMLEFGFFWWFEYLWVPNKGAYPVPSEKPKGNHNLRNPQCFISRAFAGGRSFHSGAVAVIFAEAGDLFMTWICRFLCGSLLASKQHDLTYIWRSRGLSWAAWTVCGEISLICAVCDKVEAQKYIRGCR